jgi:hypothetical protein
MALRIVGTAVMLLALVVVGGCHSQSRYGAGYCQPSGVVASAPPCGSPCNTCGTPPPPGVITAVPGH